MGIFSEALAELDRNTVDYMIDELKRKNEQLQDRYDQSQAEKAQLRDENKQLQDKYDQLQNEFDKLKASLHESGKQRNGQP